MSYAPSFLCAAFTLAVLGFWFAWPGKRTASEVSNLVMLWASGLFCGLFFAFWP